MRKTLDKLISWTGLILAAVLVVAGGLLTYASSFVADNVKQQLSQQNITMNVPDKLASQPILEKLMQTLVRNLLAQPGVPAEPTDGAAPAPAPAPAPESAPQGE